jgi:histidinol-phosphatase (PHP family)
VSFPSYSLHNHTTWSDGQTSIQEMVDEANRLGLKEIGISDHFTYAPWVQPIEWSMWPEDLSEYVLSVLSVQSATRKTRVRLGIEADFFPETVDEVRRRLREHSFDYVIGSVHFCYGFPLDSRAEDWAGLSQDKIDTIWKDYWALVRQMAESGVFDVAAHLDLPKKFGYYPSRDFVAEEQSALKAIADSGLAIEINTNGWNLPCAEAYPSLRLLTQARELGIPLVISSDAHHPRRLTEHFPRARELALAAGYTEVVYYEQRRRTALPLQRTEP